MYLLLQMLIASCYLSTVSPWRLGFSSGCFHGNGTKCTQLRYLLGNGSAAHVLREGIVSVLERVERTVNSQQRTSKVVRVLNIDVTLNARRLLVTRSTEC